MKKKLMLNSRIVRISWPIWRKKWISWKNACKKGKNYWLWSVNFVKRNSRKKWIEKACKNSPCLVKNNLNVTFANENSDSSYLCTFLIICISKRFQVCKLNANMNLHFFYFRCSLSAKCQKTISNLKKLQPWTQNITRVVENYFWWIESPREFHKEDKSYKCDFCEKTYKTRSSLTAHEMIHFDEKYYKCANLWWKFQQQIFLKKHLETHFVQEKHVKFVENSL